MPKRPTGYYRPKALDEALKLLADPDKISLAGGTKLLAGDVESAVVDLQDLGLDRIEEDNGFLNIGSMVRLNSVVTGVDGKLFTNRAETRLDQDGLFQRVLQLSGPNTYRNAATFGGTVASRLADSELLAALLAFDAEIVILSPSERHISLVEYLLPEGRPDGLITEVTIPWGSGHGSSHRVARTPADYPIVSITAWLPEDGTVRLAATGLREIPHRLKSSEGTLSDGISDVAIEQAAAKAKSATTHAGDFRGDTAYRADMAAVLTNRALRDIQAQLR